MVIEHLIYLIGHKGPITSTAITNDRRYIVTGSQDQTLIIWNLVEKIQQYVLRGHACSVDYLFITSGDRFIISCSCDSVILWNLQNMGKEGPWIPLKIKNNFNKTTAIAINGNYFATGFNNNIVKIWRVKRIC